MPDRPAPPLPLEDLEAIRQAVAGDSDLMRGADLFVTGGTGFFGRWLVESFVHWNRADGLRARMTVLSRDPDRFLQSAPHLARAAELNFLAGDVRTFRWPSEARYTHVVHAATDVVGAVPDPLTTFDVIVEGTRRVAEMARQAGIRRFLYVSSGAVYGPQAPEVSHIDEDTFFGFAPNSGRTAYAEGKRSAELLCTLHAARSPETVVPIARCFAFVGPHLPLDGHFAIGNFLDDRLNRRDLAVAGDGTPVRSYLYASDMAAWLWTILLRGQSTRAYNIGSDHAVAISELARAVAAPAGLGVTVRGSAGGTGRIDRYVPAIARACDELGCRVRVGLADAIEKTVRWHAQWRGEPSGHAQDRQSTR